jgi:hypothetical protein
MHDIIGIDWNGGEAERKPLKFDANAIGSTGLRAYGGLVDEEFLKELRGPKGAAVYREMADNDATVGAVVFAISMLLRQADWTFTAADETAEAADAKTFAEETLFDGMGKTFADVIDEICSMFVFGHAPLEIIWKKNEDGTIGIRDLALRAQPTISRWQIDMGDGTINGLWQQPLTGPLVFIPIEKLLLFRTTVQRNNPEGRSALRTAYRAWRNKKRVEEIEGVGLERDLAGLPLARIPGKFFDRDAPDEDKRVLRSYEALVRHIRMDKKQGIVLPSDTDSNGKFLYDLSLLASGGSRAIDTSKIVDRYDRQIATSVLADFIFLGQNSVGSFALSSDKTALFATAVGAFLNGIAGVFNRHLMPRLWKLNNFDPEMMPTLKPGDVETQDLAELGSFITSMAGAGMPLFPDRELENHVRTAAGLPEAPDEGIDMPTPMPIAGPGAQMAVAEHANGLPMSQAEQQAQREAAKAEKKPVAKRRWSFRPWR